MGGTVCQAVSSDPDLQLVAAVDAVAQTPGQIAAQTASQTASQTPISSDIDTFKQAKVEVAVDFTVAEAAIENLRWLAANGVHAVVGTTGFSDSDMVEIQDLFASQQPGTPNCILAPNFAVSAVLMMRFAELAAPHFSTAEIVEMHHNRKVDSPSGTALETLRRMEAASSDWSSDPTQHESLPGARGASGKHGVRVHAIRGEGLVAHQEVVLGGQGQSLTIRQDSYDRTSFMPGVLLAIKAVADTPGLTIGLEKLLGI